MKTFKSLLNRKNGERRPDYLFEIELTMTMQVGDQQL